jgi:O-antigen/teichoic acid export membrane protein
LVLPQFDIHPQAEHLFAMWVLGGGANCVVAAVQLSRALDGYRYRPALPVRLVRTVVRTGLPNHALTLVERAPNLLLPVIVTELLSPELNAYWYVAWMMAWAVLVIPVSIGVTLLAKISSGDDSLRSDIFHATRVGVGVGACGAVALALLAQPILSLLGSDYQAYSAAPLRILLLALLPVLVLQVYYSVCRSRGRLPEALLTGMLTGGIGLVATALVATNRGLDGIAWAWMATQLAAGIWAAFRLAALVPTRAEESQPPAGGLAISQPVV